MKLTLSDLQKSGNPLWRKAAGGLPDAKPRAKRFTGSTSQSKEWVREMSKGPGRFFQTGRMPNWLNTSGSYKKWMELKARQRNIALAETLTMPRFRRLPYTVTITKYGPKILDTTDGHRASLKHFVDGICDALGVDDGDESAVKFLYAPQVKSRWYGLRIEVAND